MNLLQKKYVLSTVWIYLLISFLAWMEKAPFESYYMMFPFLHLFVRYDFHAAILLTIVLFLGMALALKTKSLKIDEGLIWIGKNSTKIVLVVFVILSVGAFFVYHRYPLSMDEYMLYFQAQIFAEGRLWGQFPPSLVQWLIIPGFFVIHSAATGLVMSTYWPGFSVLLTPFIKLGIPWLLNPILGSGSLILLYYYMRRLFDDSRAASWGILLMMSSAVFMVNSISFYSLSAHLFFNLLFAVCLLEITPIRLFLAGLVGSFALVLHNPVPHIAFALPWIVWIAIKKKRFQNLGILFLGYLPLSIIMGLGWSWLQSFVTNTGKGVGADPINNSARAALEYLDFQSLSDKNWYVLLFNKVFNKLKNVFVFPNQTLLWVRIIGCLKIFAWSLPGLPILAILGFRYRNGYTHLKLWSWSAILTLIVFLFVPYTQGFGWGFRYFYPVWLALPLLGSAFLTRTKLDGAAFWKRFVFILVVFSFLFGTGLRYFQVNQFIGAQLSQLPVLEKGKRYVCFLKIDDAGYFLQDMIHNDPFLRGPVIMLRHINEREDMDMLKNMFPNAVRVEDCSLYSVWELKGEGSQALRPQQFQ
jgi:hypothetical protein